MIAVRFAPMGTTRMGIKFVTVETHLVLVFLLLLLLLFFVVVVLSNHLFTNLYLSILSIELECVFCLVKKFAPVFLLCCCCCFAVLMLVGCKIFFYFSRKTRMILNFESKRAIASLFKNDFKTIDLPLFSCVCKCFRCPVL